MSNELPEWLLKTEEYYCNYRTLDDVLDYKGKTYLGTKENQRCRFCGRGKPDVTFKKKAHAISEMLGNRFLCSFYECDSCNWDIFSKLENELGMFTEPQRAMTQMIGKNGIPTFKQPGFEFRSEYEGGIVIKNQIDNDVLEWNEAKNELVLKVKRKPFIPRAVYKAFVKMAISLVPESEVPNFQETIKWLLETDHSARTVPPLVGYYHFIPGPGYEHTQYRLFFRNKGAPSSLPYCQFAIRSKNVMYQVYIPFSSNDVEWTEDNKLWLSPYPTAFEFGYPFEIQSEKINLTSAEKQPAKELSITFQYDKRVEITEEYRSEITEQERENRESTNQQKD